jgi:hypothetical protein
MLVNTPHQLNRYVVVLAAAYSWAKSTIADCTQGINPVDKKTRPASA